MVSISQEQIRSEVADSNVIFKRGFALYRHGAFLRREADAENGYFTYEVDGNYGDYITRVRLTEGTICVECDCPYPGNGCKHAVAALLDARDIMAQWSDAVKAESDAAAIHKEKFLTPDEIRNRALEERRKRARLESFAVTYGDMSKGEHFVETDRGRQYTVTLHDPVNGKGHCSCPDYHANRLGTCKHLIFLLNHIKRQRGFKTRIAKERFPFIDIYWNSEDDAPRVFCELTKSRLGKVSTILSDYFDTEGRFSGATLSEMVRLLSRLDGDKRIRIRSRVFQRVEAFLQDQQLKDLSRKGADLPSNLRVQLYPYQEEGIRFGLYKKAVLIGDEMGLGKTLQAIVLSIMKKEIFEFRKVVVITLASLKEQWKREITRFTDESVTLIAGRPQQRHAQYFDENSFFKITNYEAVLRDVTLFSRYKPDLVILDEAQRIKNFSTKTAEAVKQIPRKHAMVLTGTPLENKLEDVYSIVQFLDPHLLSPLWHFAADHFMLCRDKKDKILGYRNLDALRENLKPIVIRRKKEDVLSDLPDQIVNNYYVDLHEKQHEIHAGYAAALAPLLNKKFLTPIDVRRMQELLLKMRMVCDSTYLVDRQTQISPKLRELDGILEELAILNNRKMVIFSEWTTMTYLIAKHLSERQLPFVELSGKIPVKKRQALIDEFTNNPECKIFLSTDAGGTGLNLQAADCVVNFELPWNPSRMNQRIGRINRIGQKSRCINVINLIAKHSIEERIYAGIQLKTDLFEGVFENGKSEVEFSREKRTEMLNRLREMMGEMQKVVVAEPASVKEIPEDTPHYLNPKVLNPESSLLDFTGEEADAAPESSEAALSAHGGMDAPKGVDAGFSWAAQTPARVEAVLDSGMQFIGGLLEMATGQQLSASSADGRMVRIDRETGEVTLKFQLPGF